MEARTMTDLQPLTAKQAAVLRYIRTCMEHGHWPTMREIAAEFGFFFNAATNHIKALIRKGHVWKDSRVSGVKARTLHLRCLQTSIPIRTLEELRNGILA
jgi:DNA-binding MarR family transcriptional regulator